VAKQTKVIDRIERNGRRVRERHSAGRDRPLFAYSMVIGVYTGLVGLVSTALTAIAVSDTLQILYDGAKNHAGGQGRA
jgi:hypothetical protein